MITLTKEQQSKIHLSILYYMLENPSTSISENNFSNGDNIELSHEGVHVGISSLNQYDSILKFENKKSGNKYSLIIPLNEIAPFAVDFYNRMNTEYQDDFIYRHSKNKDEAYTKKITTKYLDSLNTLKEFLAGDKSKNPEEIVHLNLYTLKIKLSNKENEKEHFIFSVNTNHIYQPLAAIPVKIMHNDSNYVFHISIFELEQYPVLKDLIKTKLDPEFQDISLFNQKLTGDMSMYFLNSHLSEVISPSKKHYKSKKI